MKKIKGLIAILMITIILFGSTGLYSLNDSVRVGSDSNVFPITVQYDPDPVDH